MVHTDQKGIAIVFAGQIGDVVLDWSGGVIDRIVILCQTCRDRTDAICRDNIVRERQPADGVHDRLTQAGEVSCLLCGRGNTCTAENTPTLACAVVVAKEEGTILLDGTATCRPKLITAERSLLGRRRQEEVAGIELIVADELPKGSVEIVRS